MKREKNAVKMYVYTGLIGILSKIVNLKFQWNTKLKSEKLKFEIWTYGNEAVDSMPVCATGLLHNIIWA